MPAVPFVRNSEINYGTQVSKMIQHGELTNKILRHSKIEGDFLLYNSGKILYNNLD